MDITHQEAERIAKRICRLHYVPAERDFREMKKLFGSAPTLRKLIQHVLMEGQPAPAENERRP